MISVYITTSSNEESEKIARVLLEKRLVACCNIVEKINSMYWWDGEIVNDSESLIIAKTLRNKFDDVKSTVKDIHSYDIPCILAIPIIGSSENYKNWIEEELAN
ncbi:MAG: divalent-cation tolerance protein CutA [Methanobacteriaceae archaeon]